MGVSRAGEPGISQRERGYLAVPEGEVPRLCLTVHFGTALLCQRACSLQSPFLHDHSRFSKQPSEVRSICHIKN